MPGLPETERAKEGSSSRGFRGCMVLSIFNFGLLCLELWVNKFVILKPSSLWYFVSAAIGNKYRIK